MDYNFKHMSPEDRQRAIERGLIQAPKSKSFGGKKKSSWTLVWKLGNMEQTIVSNKPYGYCVAVRKRKEKEIQYKRGEFKIK